MLNLSVTIGVVFPIILAMKNLVAIFAMIAVFCPTATLTAAPTKTSTFNDGDTKRVRTSYTEGKLSGKTKSSDTFLKGKQTEAKDYFYDTEGNTIYVVTVERKGGETTVADVKFNASGGRFGHTIVYGDDVFDIAKRSALDKTLAPLLASPYNTQNVEVAAALSADGKSLVLTLKNISSAKMNVHDGVFTTPSILYYWPGGGNTFGTATHTIEGQGISQDSVKSLAPGESLRCEATLKDIYGSHASRYANSEPKDLLYVTVTFSKELFPLPPGVKSARTSLGRFSLGRLNDIRAKNPGVFGE